MKRLILLALAGAALSAHAEPLNYDYVYFSSNDIESDGGGEDRGDAYGGFWSFAETLHVFGSYDDAGIYSGGGENPAWDYNTRTVRVGLGGHYLIGKRTMIAPSVAWLRSRSRINAPSWSAPREYTDTGYGVQLDLRHAFTNWFEITGGVRHARVFDTSHTDLVGGVLFHPTDWLALGALYHDGDERRSTELTLRWYY